jgi:VIT1/CCC1 family predicted Fe2+/Mn2+ transporter
MHQKQLSAHALDILRAMQQEEVDSHAIYLRVARSVKDANRAILERIAADELGHSRVWESYTKISCKPNRLRVWVYGLLARTLGFTFTVKLLEKGEVFGQDVYAKLEDEVPEIAAVRADEARHEEELIGMLDEERLKFVGSMVLGMNDALVELTGALAGFTFAMRDTRLVALAGLITGISATLSMTSSSYLSAKADEDPDALKSSLYTGTMYLLTVALMVAPFLLLPSSMVYWALGAMFTVVVAIIAGFNFYISIAKDLSFRKRFLEMFILCVAVTGVSFAIGSIVKHFLGIELG